MNVVTQGYRLIYDKEAVAHELSRTMWKEEFSRKSSVIAGAVRALKQNEGIPSMYDKLLFFGFFSHKLLRWMVPVFMISFFYFNFRIVFYEESPFYVTFFIGQIIFYLLAFVGLLKLSSKSPLLKIPFYFCLVNGAALYGIYKGIFNKQTVKWKKVSR